MCVNVLRYSLNGLFFIVIILRANFSTVYLAKIILPLNYDQIESISNQSVNQRLARPDFILNFWPSTETSPGDSQHTAVSHHGSGSAHAARSSDAELQNPPTPSDLTLAAQTSEFAGRLESSAIFWPRSTIFLLGLDSHEPYRNLWIYIIEPVIKSRDDRNQNFLRTQSLKIKLFKIKKLKLFSSSFYDRCL